MAKNAKRGFLSAGVALFLLLVVPVLWIGRFFDSFQAASEYFRPTTVESGFVPRGCAQTGQAPPPDLMHIVESQRDLHHLVLQRVVVCRTPYPLPGFERRLTGFPVGEDDPWWPLHGDCCARQYRRHVIVIAADRDGGGSVLLQAALIQSRWDYLRLDWNRVRPWAWRWCFIVSLFLICARSLFVSGRWLGKTIRQRLGRRA